MTNQMKSSAVLSSCFTYRYVLERRWGGMPPLTYVMLNPSTADDAVDDPTIRKCLGFARRLGYEAITVVNLFALRATDPSELLTADDPVGPNNDAYIRDVLAVPSQIVVAWGGASKARKVLMPRRQWFLDTFAARIARGHIYCLGTTKSGDPRHPLMLGYDTKLQPWTPNPETLR